MPLLSEVNASLPPLPLQSRLDSIREKSNRIDRTIVVLDDDPTGTQTVYDVPVLTEWSRESIEAEFAAKRPIFFILTNSRSVDQQSACRIATEIGMALTQASAATGREFEVISRSDSTLRGHYPAEVDALAQSIGDADVPRLLVPFFAEGNRLTVGDTHYVAQGDELIPASETPFARDTYFGYQNSNLRDWVQEKTAGVISSSDVDSLSIRQLRTCSADAAACLQRIPPGGVCVVNSLAMGDQELFVDALLDACLQGSRFVYRTAASFVQVRAGLEPRKLLTRDEIVGRENQAGGLIVVGSYVPKTTQQLRALLDGESHLTALEVDVSRLVDPQSRADHIAEVSRPLGAAITSGSDIVVYTSREHQATGNAAQDLANGKLVSSGLVEIVSSLTERPAFFIAKGGITSSDMATEALEVRRATVMGQILPGVPVWKLSDESRFPGMGFVVFPGNVGDEEALLVAYRKLRR